MFITAYGEKRKASIDFSNEKSLTKQSFKEVCDINCMIARAARGGGIMPPDKPLVFGDATNGDYVSMMRILADGQSAFMELPAKVRREFDNDPALFMDAFSDPGQVDKLEELGLIAVRKPVEAPVEASAAPQDSPVA